jgi:diacylglycerol kinase (ATP)
MRDRSYFIIHNPTAGRGRAARTWRRIEPVLREAGVRYEVATTGAPHHAEALAERAARAGWDAVVAVGGDGTVQQVASGLVRAAGDEPSLPLGIIGVGSGNDFIKLLDLPLQQPERAARRLLAATPRRVDIGRMNGRFFTNGVGIGFDAQVAARAARIRWLRGIPLYGAALLQMLPTLRAPRIRLELDGEVVADRQLTLVTVGNGACHGGGFWICPDARPDDGLFDVCIAEALSVPRLLHVIPHVMRGTHVRFPEVRILRAKRVRVSSPDPLPMHADGEVFGDTLREIEMEILAGRLTVLA